MMLVELVHQLGILRRQVHFEIFRCAANTRVLPHVKCNVLYILVVNNIIVFFIYKCNVICVKFLFVLPRLHTTACVNNNKYYILTLWNNNVRSYVSASQ